MAEIAWWVWILIGIMVAGISLYLGQQFLLFLIVGLLILAFGFFKGVSSFILSKKEGASEKAVAQASLATQWLRCSACGRLSHPIANYCYACGARVK